MDYLQNIISSLDSAEKREFQYFIQRNKQKSQRKDLDLFKIYCQENIPKAKTQIEKLGFPNANAYHSTRKRLYAHLSDFAVIKSMDEDQSSASKVSGLFHIARHLFQRNLNRIAWNVLTKAEDLAVKNECFAELNSIYILQADKIQFQDKLSIATVLRNYDDNRVRVEEEERIALLRSELRERIRQALATGREVQWVMIVRETLQKAPMRRDISQSPRLLCAMLLTIRDTAKHSKEYLSFENLATSLYSGLNDKRNHVVNVEILYMIVHSKYRNKRFREAGEYGDQMLNELKRCSKTMQKNMEARVSLLRAANGLFSGKLDESIKILESLLQKKISVKAQCNATLNLAVYQFYAGDFRSALRTLNLFTHSDKWYQNKMGVEWCLKQKMIELLIVVELEEGDLFESRLRSIERRFKEIFEKEKYQKAKAFISLVKSYHHRLNELNLDELKSRIEVSWEWLPVEQEDLQAMMFYAWLRSKITKENCYQVLLELVGVAVY